MSTRQRATLDMTTNPVPEGALLLAHTANDGATSSSDAITLEPAEAAAPVGDIAAQRLRALAERLSGSAPLATDDDLRAPLGAADAEFEPVSLASLMELRSKRGPDAPGDLLIEPTEDSEPAATRLLEPPPRAVIETPAATTAMVEVPEPLRLSGEPAIVDASTATIVSFPDEITTPPPPAPGEPLMLADQSTTDIRLVDLIRRQQTLLDQLNRFPPSYDATAHAAEDARITAEPPAQRSIVEQLAPPALPAPSPEPVQSEREAPPPLPPPERLASPRVEPATPAQLERAALPPPQLQPLSPPKRERPDEPAEHELPQHSPMIIQRARAERSGALPGGQTARPPSAIPAFLAGLAVALVIAGALFVVL